MIYESDKYTLFSTTQKSFSSSSPQCVQVIYDGLLQLLKQCVLCFPSQMQIYLYNSDDFDSLSAAIKERRIIAAMSVFFEVKFPQGRDSRQRKSDILLIDR